MSIKVLIKKDTANKLESLPADIKQRIKKSLNDLENTWPICRLDIKRLRGSERHYRIRVGDHRIFFVRDNDAIKIYDIRHRSNAYKD